MEKINGKFQLTPSDISNLMCDDHDDFEVLYDDIPRDGHSSLYIEDDGRQMRIFEAKHKPTDEIITANYIYHHEFGSEGFSFSDNVEMVPEPPKPKAPEPEPEPLTPEQIADKELWERYKARENIGVRPFDEAKSEIPYSVIEDAKKFLDTREFSMYQLRAKLLPICIDYRVEQSSLLRHLQGRK